ncbi:hypothetical protein quinque_012127 [Culex quinquefasciatus]
MVLSNNLPKDSTKGPLEGYQRTVFEDTPVDAAVPAGIIVSDFQGIPSAMDPRQSVYARYNAIRNGEANFILEAGTKILNILEQYLQTPVCAAQDLSGGSAGLCRRSDGKLRIGNVQGGEILLRQTVQPDEAAARDSYRSGA